MSVASVWTQTPGQSLESAVLVIVSNKPIKVMIGKLKKHFIFKEKDNIIALMLLEATQNKICGKLVTAFIYEGFGTFYSNRNKQLINVWCVYGICINSKCAIHT